MISELYIKDFAIIDELRLHLAPGFTVLTGETGAGKSIILDAVMLLLGGRAETTVVRAGCDTAYVEGIFELPPAFQEAVAPLLAREGVDSGDPTSLLLAREIRVEGRNICRVNGRAVTLSFLSEISEQLVDIHGQGEHLSLLRPRAHLPLLDAYAGLREEQRALAREVTELRRLENQLLERRRNARNIAQRIDMLEFQVTEIDAAMLEPGEEEELRAERARQANMEQLMEYTGEALALLYGEDDELPAALDQLSHAERALGHLARLDETKEPWLERLEGLSSEVSDLARELRHYQEELEFNPGRLDFLEERLELINNLKRKYGDSIEEVLEFRDEAAAELKAISHNEERMETLAAEVERYLHRIGELGQALSEKRRAAADELAAAVERELEDLRMSGAHFAVDFQREGDPHGAFVADEHGQDRVAFDNTGIDRLEFLISTNPGEPLKPMAKVASGGETARLMLALKTALAQVDETPTLIFDEIDQGIGGRVGDVVGRKLWGLTARGDHQVVVVTHLPQLAGYGDAHYHVSKGLSDGRTVTAVSRLERAERVQELAAMLGTSDEAGRQGAEAILEQAAASKGRKRAPAGA
ncbi:MAG: DNA repair protein RecN [Candidatus Promineifilaceae bacterium]|nr:DNA repair protein RecN [Candidatus Promineifilaceae bacterium]